MAVANEHTELARIGEVLDCSPPAGDVALVTDAGTPGISDPGERLVRAVVDAGHRGVGRPGPGGARHGAGVSGLDTTRFVFEGFLPRSGRDRTRRLDEIAAERRTVVMYEAPHRIARTVADLARRLRRRSTGRGAPAS